MSRLSRMRDQEGGYSMIEMLVTMAILGTVMAAITSLFVTGTRAQVDMNERFQGQQAARLALTKMRREVHCATSAAGQGTPDANGYYNHVLLTLASFCKTGTGQVSWCTVAFTGSTTRYRLFRQTGSTCGTNGVRWADYLTSAYLFKPDSATSGQLAKLGVTFPVDLRPQDTQRSYRLTDSIVLRNSTRAA